LIARLESAVTNALKAPVIANVEYNYERDGTIVVPAGTKVVGELQQASSNGFVGISFHTLRFADGRDEKIEAIAMSLQSEPLKGEVSGTNNGKRIVTRALSGVGTVAAYIVGGGASDLGKPISGSMLLRDRIAGNVALAGEQELTNNVYSQSTVVTVPAQTRLYVVLQKPALQQPREEKNEVASARSGAEMPSVQELRELMSLKREIDQMYEASKARTNVGK
jgi:hypothetical protein